MWNGEAYVYQREGVNRSTGEQVDFVKEIIDNYGFYYIEDPIREDDFDGFAELTRKAGNKCLICGDDLYVTNAEILQEGINKKSAIQSSLTQPNWNTHRHLPDSGTRPEQQSGSSGKPPLR